MRCPISQAVVTLLANPKPVILLDTCALLDIVRSAFRTNVKVSHLEGAKNLLIKASAGQLQLIVTTTVEHEFKENLKAVSTELDRVIADLASKNATIISAIECVGLSYRFSVDGMTAVKLTDSLQGIAEQMINAAIVLDRDSNCESKAFDRVERYQAPATRGKSESKDCLIIEHYIKLVNELRDAGFNMPSIFVSSNSADYGNVSAMRAPLDTDFKGTNITYVNNFAWALQLAFPVIASGNSQTINS